MCVYIIYIHGCVLTWGIPQIVNLNQVNRESDDYITRSTLFLDKDISLYTYILEYVYIIVYIYII